jgi:predicted ATPase
MITKLFVQNYRSIRQAELTLGPLTALVGPNGAGKSNLADALRFLSDCVNASLSHAMAARHGFGAVQRRGAGRSAVMVLGVEVQGEHSGGSWTVHIAASRDGADGFSIRKEFVTWGYKLGGKYIPESTFVRVGSDIEIHGLSAHKVVPPFALGDSSLLLPLLEKGPPAALVQQLRRVAIYAPFPNTLRAAQLPNPVQPMTSSGDNWASTLNALNRKTWGAELIAALHHIVGDISDYRVAQAGGYLIPEFRHGTARSKKQERWLGAAQESDGTLRVAAILTALFQQPPLSLIGFEEPELAVHPGALPVLFDFLKEASTRSQVLLTTHSPELLDLLDIESIRVVERHKGTTTVSPVEERQRKLVKERLFSTSELLHAEGLHGEGGRDGDEG